MNATVVYEIERYKLSKANSVFLERLQLVEDEGSLRLRDADGNELPCEETDIVAAIASRPALHRVLERQQAHITCAMDIVGQLPALFESIPKNASLIVNGQDWDAFPSIDGGYVMLPGDSHFDDPPEMNPCWAEYCCAEGGRNFEEQLIGFSSIGLLAPGVAVEHGRTEYGGNGGVVEVSITSFDDFAALFIDWLLRTPVLSGFWHGYRDISSPDVDLFAEAAVASNHQAHWEDDDTPEQEDDGNEDEDEDADDETSSWDDEGSFASRSLELHLPQDLIDEIRANLSAMNPEYAAALALPAVSPEA